MKQVYWKIVAKLFPKYFQRSLQKDFNKLGEIFMRESPIQKRLRSR